MIQIGIMGSWCRPVRENREPSGIGYPEALSVCLLPKLTDSIKIGNRLLIGAETPEGGNMRVERLKTVDVVIPVFREYLTAMRRFYPIVNPVEWRENALRNLGRNVHKKGNHLFAGFMGTDVIGFALVNRHLRFNSGGHAIADFYVRPEYERKGYGRRLALHAFSAIPGSWEVTVASANADARLFWTTVLKDINGGFYRTETNSRFDGTGFLFDSLSDNGGNGSKG
jgi:predicted acetyltransferase